MPEMNFKTPEDIAKQLPGWTIRSAAVLPNNAVRFVITAPWAEHEVELTITPDVSITITGYMIASRPITHFTVRDVIAEKEETQEK